MSTVSQENGKRFQHVWWQSLLPLVGVTAGVVVGILFYDFGIFSSYHVRHDFDEIFNYRKTGHCDAFSERTIIDSVNWWQKCINERDGWDDDELPIATWKIHGISIEKDKAFLQVELMRDTTLLEYELAKNGHGLPDKGYLVNYQMTRLNGDWYLDQRVSR